MAPKSLLILGATGQTGHHLIKQALSQPLPPKLTLYVRNPSKLPHNCQDNPNVRIVNGSLDGKAALSSALDGIDAVIIVLGAYPELRAFVVRDTSTPIANSLPTLFEAMREKHVKRILALSTPVHGVPGEAKNWTWTAFSLMPAVMVPQGNAEMAAIGAQVAAQDDLDWTVFRVPFLTEASADLEVHAGLLGPDYKGSTSLSRPSLAKWILQEVQEGKWIKRSPVLGN